MRNLTGDELLAVFGGGREGRGEGNDHKDDKDNRGRDRDREDDDDEHKRDCGNDGRGRR